MVFPRTWSRIVWNSEPWRGLVKKSASMFSTRIYMTVTMRQLLIVIMIVILTVVIEMVRNNICKQYFKGVVTGIPVYRIRLGTIFVRFPKFGTKKAIFTLERVIVLF